MKNVHHRTLPDHWALICGRDPPDAYAFKSENLQIIYNNTSVPWSDETPHAHAASDEVYIVLEGTMVVQVEQEQVNVGAGELLCVPAGTSHQLVSVGVPVRSFVIRSPSINDKVLPTTPKARPSAA